MLALLFEDADQSFLSLYIYTHTCLLPPSSSLALAQLPLCLAIREPLATFRQPEWYHCDYHVSLYWPHPSSNFVATNMMVFCSLDFYCRHYRLPFCHWWAPFGAVDSPHQPPSCHQYFKPGLDCHWQLHIYRQLTLLFVAIFWLAGGQTPLTITTIAFPSPSFIVHY